MTMGPGQVPKKAWVQSIPWAYLALLVVSLGTGLALGMDVQAILDAIQNGMGGTLGFVQ